MYHGDFIKAIQNKSIDTVFWESEIRNGNIDLHRNDEELFMWCCNNGPLKLAQWLYALSISGSQNNTVVNNNPHRQKWIDANLNKVIDIHAQNNRAFMRCCLCGHFDIAQWLYTLSPNVLMNLHDNNESLFRLCCQFDSSELLQWLYSLDNTINIRVLNDEGFRWACGHGRLKTAKWLCTLVSAYHVGQAFGGIHSVISDPNNPLIEDKELLRFFPITKKIIVSEAPKCAVCQEPHNNSIQFQCGHCICFDKIIHNHVRQRFVEHIDPPKVCMHCQEPFEWPECTNIIVHKPTTADQSKL